MVTNIEQAKMRLSLSTGLDLAEVQLLLKDVYSQIDTLQNEIRKL